MTRRAFLLCGLSLASTASVWACERRRGIEERAELERLRNERNAILADLLETRRERELLKYDVERLTNHDAP